MRAGQAVPDNWIVVAPGGVSGDGTTPRRLHALSGATMRLVTVPAPPGGGMTTQPWVVNGPYVAAITGQALPRAHQAPVEGVAYAFRPGGPYIRLGSAVSVYAASQQGLFWLETASFGHVQDPAARPRQCMLAEVSVNGQRVAGPFAVSCSRWLLAAVAGGFLSMPTKIARAATYGGVRAWEFGLGGFQFDEAPLQLWNPRTGRVVRTYSVRSRWILGANQHYLAWLGNVKSGKDSFDVTELATGLTRLIRLPIRRGDVMWLEPVLAPGGPLVAWMEVTRSEAVRLNSVMHISPGGGGAPALPGPGRVEVINVLTGRVVTDRAVTVASAGAFDWSPDDHYLFVASSYSALSVVPVTSAADPVRLLHLGTGAGGIPDVEQLLVTARTSG